MKTSMIIALALAAAPFAAQAQDNTYAEAPALAAALGAHFGANAGLRADLDLSQSETTGSWGTGASEAAAGLEIGGHIAYVMDVAVAAGAGQAVVASASAGRFGADATAAASSSFLPQVSLESNRGDSWGAKANAR